MDPKPRFTPKVEEVLRDSGWFEGRKLEGSLELPGDFQIFPAATRVLSEFGGLKGGYAGPGIHKATSDFDLRPALAWGEADRFREFEEQLRVRLYPLGEAHHRHFFLAIDERGQVYGLMDDIKLLARDFDSAIESLILGRHVDLE